MEKCVECDVEAAKVSIFIEDSNLAVRGDHDLGRADTAIGVWWHKVASLATCPLSTDGLRRERNVVVLTGCTFDDALRIADAIGRSGDRALFDRWLRIADYLAAGRANLLANLGDLLSRHGTDADEPQVLAYYETARLGGSRAAIHRLLNLYSRRTAAAYDPERSAALFVDLVAASGPQDLPGSLSRLRSATPEIRAIARRSIDEAALYLSAAQSGSAVAMREYALLLRADATTPAQILESTDWLRRAADAGQMAAMIDLADALVFGVGTAPSRDQALGWLEKAADLGSADAAQRLRTLQLSSGVGQ